VIQLGSKADDHLLLLGHPPASDFFQAMRNQMLGGEAVESADLVQEWRKARAWVRELEGRELGLADAVPLAALPEEMTQAAAGWLADPSIEHTHRLMQRRWVWLELDRIAVFQKRIDLTWVKAIQDHLGQAPDPVGIVNIAAGKDIAPLDIQVTRSSEDSYVLSCKSGELQFFGTKLLDPRLLPPRLNRDVSQVVAAFVGFGMRAVSAVRYRGRVILTNGTHRAYALRDLGLSHVPCLLVDVDQSDEMELVGVGSARPLIEHCARMPRPPLFKDYFDPRLRKIVPLERTRHAIQVQITCNVLRIPGAS
jgi:hypothetical protein